MLWFANDKTLINIATIAVIHSTGPQAQKIWLLLINWPLVQIHGHYFGKKKNPER